MVEHQETVGDVGAVPDMAAVEGPVLHRAMGLWEAVALGVGGTIGGGIFILVGAAAGMAGPAALLAFVLAFLASLSIALPYAQMACEVPRAGGGYAFVRAALGAQWGFTMGWAFWGAYVFISGYVTLGFGGYLAALAGPEPITGAVALVLAATVVNVAGIRLSGKVQVVVVALALTALVVFAAAGASHVDASRLNPFFPKGWRTVFSAALLAFLAFGGFDMVAAAAEEVRRPERNVPLAILLTLVVVLGVYGAVTLVAVGVVPWQALGRSSAPLRDAAQSFAGSRGATLVCIAAVLTTAATANAVLVVTSRITFAMARDGLLPPFLGRVGRRTGAPTAAVLLNGALLATVAWIGSVHSATAIGGFLYVVHFVPAVLPLLWRRRSPARPAFRTPVPRLVVPLALSACAILLVASGPVGALGGVFWLLLGQVLRQRLSTPAGTVPQGGRML